MPSTNQHDAHDDERASVKRKRNRKPVSYVLEDTEHLHEKIEMMGKRIAELEEALEKLQLHISNVPHPLLADDLRLIKAPPSTQSAMKALNEETEEVAKSLGTLTLGDRPRFFGPHAAVDYLLMDDSLDEIPATTEGLCVDVQLLDMFPMPVSGMARSRILSGLVGCLPPAEQASYIIDRFYTQTSWFFVIISDGELRETIFSRVYGRNGPTLADVSPHEIAILFLILACGHVFGPVHPPDMNHSPDDSSGTKYYQLARVAFALDSVLDHPTIQAIRALHMMSLFAQMTDLPNSPTTCYILMGLAARLCQCLGLHRDDTQWDLSDSERQKRRRVFWEVATYDLWSSLAYGRPPSFTMAHVDAKVADEFTTEASQRSVSFCSWAHTFTCRVLPKLVDQAFGVTPLSYSTVLRLDQLVREHPVNEALRTVDGVEDDQSISTPLLLQRNSVLSLTQRLILYLHRSFFARALLENPEDPLKSKYAQSVLAVFRAAVRLNVSVRTLYARSPRTLGPEFWVFWTPCFSSCLVLQQLFFFLAEPLFRETKRRSSQSGDVLHAHSTGPTGR
ncbi:hypothetical protein AURDEDRAFT_186302 [Auricularia subglabra TFB-10046 SS5]|nr:hypothetical protein AURDEDRAFT_186302 [Auricularia subglabra TFB-10046 SS5]